MHASERLRLSDFPPPFKLLTSAVAAAVLLLLAAGWLVWQSFDLSEAPVHAAVEAASETREASVAPPPGEQVALPAEPLSSVSLLRTSLLLRVAGGGPALEASPAPVPAPAGQIASLRRNRVYFGLLLLGIVVLLVGAWVGVLRQFSYYFAERQHSIETISESESRNIALLHALPDTIFLIDRDGRFLDFHARNEMAGFSGGQFIGRNVREVLPPDIARETMRAVEAALTAGDTETFEYVVPAPTDESEAQHFEARIVSCWGDRALAIVRNITAREQAEQTIREAESKFRILVEQSVTGIYIFQDDRFVYANPRFAAILGYTPEQIMTMQTVLDMVVPEDRAMLRERLEDDLARHDQNAHYSLRCIRKDGTIIYTEFFTSRIEYRGRPAFIGTLLDVTEQREAQEKLRVLGMAVEQSAEGVLVFDTGGIVRFVNPAWAAMHGYTVEEVTGLHFRIFHTEEQMRKEVFPVIHRFEKTRIYQAEMGHKRKDGSTFPSSTAFASMRDPNGNVIGAVGICRDITAQKQYEAELLAAKERAEELSRLKSAFLTNMSHEIRTPLTGILGFATVLEEEVPTAQREFAQLIRSSGERLMTTLNAVLDLARLEAGEMTVLPRPVDLRHEIEEASGIYRMLASEKRLAFDLSFPPAALEARLDPAALTLILNNLVGNAIKFTEAGRVRVDVTADADAVQIQVADSGVGIEPDFLPYIFEEFKQESIGLTRSHEGSGLGLAITKRLVDLMQGRIDVQSAKGEGTTFTVVLPRFSVEASELSHAA